MITVTNAATPTYTFSVVSTYGSPTPSGITTNDANTEITAYIPDSPVVVNSATQYICTGWVGTGSLTSGSGTNVTFTITNVTTISWQWKTNYWINLNTIGE